MSEVDLKESEQEALADMALADLASELGMVRKSQQRKPQRPKAKNQNRNKAG